MTFKVEQSGWYRTRDGREAEVVVNPNPDAKYPVSGYVLYGYYGGMMWSRNGERTIGQTIDSDLVEYLGKERPKRNKVVRTAPALINQQGNLAISVWLYKSEQEAKDNFKNCFVRWLIDSHAVEVEVPDNGLS